MLNNKKIRVMTNLALYEEDSGKEDLKLGKYYKTDYVRFQTLKSVVCATIGYALILIMIGMYHSEYLISKAVTLDFIRIGEIVLGIYIIVIAIYVVGSIIGYSMKYDNSRKQLSQYYKSLKKLSNIYHEESGNESQEAK